jgi:glycosyltransferase involved in cell wall biosynthesis
VFFSIIIPVYNAEKYLHRCVDSVLNQSFTDFELLLINDGSVDSSFDICNEYQTKDPRIKVIHKNNEGIGLTRNVGINNAIGEYFILLDNDDMLSENSLTNLFEFIQKFPKKDIFVMPHIELKDNKYHKKKATLFSKLINKVITGPDFIKYQQYTYYFGLQPWKYVYNTNFIRENNLFFTAHQIEDVEWLPRVFLKANSVVISDIVLYIHNVRQGSESRSNSVLRTQKVIELCFEQENIFSQINDKLLKNLLLDFVHELYLRHVLKGKLYDDPIKYKLNDDFIKGRGNYLYLNFCIKLYFMNKNLCRFFYKNTSKLHKQTRRLLKLSFNW